MKKILHVIDSLQTGGAEILLYTTIRKLPGFEHHIIILEEGIAFSDIHQYATIHPINHGGWSDLLKSIDKIKTIEKNIKADIVHAHLFLASFLTRMAVRKHPNLVYTLHTLFSEVVFKRFHLKQLEKLAFKKEHKLIAVSHYVLEDYRKEIKTEEGYVLYNFLADEFFDEKESKIDIKQGQLNKWVAVGSLKSVKNYEGMIDLFKCLYDTVDDKLNLQLDIYGEGSLKNELQEQINLLGIPVRLMGKVENIAGILKQYDAYVSASVYEGYGIAPMEALAVGLPLFLSDIPVYKEVYQDHAFYFKNDEIASLRQAHNEYCELAEDVKESRQKRGKEYAYQTANSNQYITKLLEIYQS